MTIRFFLFGAFGFVVGALMVTAYMHGPQLARERTEAKAPAFRQSVTNEEFEAIERRLRDPRNREWNLLEDMQPCFPGSKLCFLLSDRPAARDHQIGL